MESKLTHSKIKGDKTMKNTFEIEIAGCKRNLPICSVNEHLDIAAFIMFGDVEITEKCAYELLKICPEFDILATAESKGIPLCYEMARQSKKDYVVARKSQKIYMNDSICTAVKSITTAEIQKLYLSGTDINKVKNKKILIVDDVISTGNSLLAVEKLIEKASGKIAGKVCVLAEGNAANRKDIIFLNSLPIFEK